MPALQSTPLSEVLAGIPPLLLPSELPVCCVTVRRFVSRLLLGILLLYLIVILPRRTSRCLCHAQPQDSTLPVAQSLRQEHLISLDGLQQVSQLPGRDFQLSRMALMTSP